MRYDSTIKESHSWTGKYPEGSSRSEKIWIYFANLLDDDVESWDKLVNREVRDKLTELSLSGVSRNINRRLNNLKRDLKRSRKQDIKDWLQRMYDHASEVFATDPYEVGPDLIATVDDWKKSGSYEIAVSPSVENIEESDDVKRISRRGSKVRVTTDGTNFHKRWIVINDGPRVQLIERGYRGTLFIGNG